MKAFFRKILRALLPDYYTKKDLIAHIRKHRRIIISPIEGTPFKLVGVSDDRESIRTDP